MIGGYIYVYIYVYIYIYIYIYIILTTNSAPGILLGESGFSKIPFELSALNFVASAAAAEDYPDVYIYLSIYTYTYIYIYIYMYKCSSH